MAPKKNISSSSSCSPIPIGNCEVLVEAKKFTTESDSNSLQISLSRNVKIKILVREEMKGKFTDVWHPESEGKVNEERTYTLGDGYSFLLINPKDADSCSKSYLQEVLKLYMKELPTMNYAANTGKESMFLERCVSNGKYCTLLVKLKSMEGSGEVIAAITYQIVPADTQYAEIPLAAVSAIYQHKGLGHLLYAELRNRLQSVGIRTILCWGDKESEGFWLKQGFASIAEVDTKGRARRLPIKTDIRRALCFPGGSTLMVSHLNSDTSADPADSLKLCSSLAIDKFLRPGFTREVYNGLKSLNQTATRRESSRTVGLVNDEFSSAHTELGGCSRIWDSMHGCMDLAPFEGVECDNMASGAELSKIRADAYVKQCSCATQGAKKRVWEASLSSLKSKKVKGSHQNDCPLDSNWGSVSGNDINGSCFDDCSLSIMRNKSLAEVTHEDPLTGSCMDINGNEVRRVNMNSEAPNCKELQSKGESFRIMLMNIADDSKKTHLTKVIENLGGSVTSVGSVSTHVVTGKVRKTLNFCTALCSGAWIVSPSWLKESFREGRFVDELPYILEDKEYVLKYRTELKDAVLRAKARRCSLLKGYNICIAAHVQPPVETLSAIVRSAGGNIICGADKVIEASKTIFIACEDDMEEALLAVKKGIWTFSSDWLMNCVMRQELDLEAPQYAESL